MRTEVITEIGTLEQLEADWWDLFHRVPSATPFSSPAWLLPWWRIFAPGTLFAVAVRMNTNLVGLALLYVEQSPDQRRLLPMGLGISDFADVLLDPRHADATRTALVEAIAAGRDRWECWSIEEAPPGAAVLALANPSGCGSMVSPQSACPVLALPGNGSSAAIPPRKQRKWRMAQNRTARRAWSLDTTTAATLSADLAHLFRLHGARWQSKGELGVLADGAVRRFHEAAARALLEAGLLQMTTLRIDGVVAGVYYGVRHGPAAYAYLGGFDPAFAFESPGTQLIGAAIEKAAAEGARDFHFLRGQEPYKYEWGASDRWNSRRLVEPIR